MPGRTTNDAPLLAARPLNVTVLVPWLAPKLAPVMVIAMPALPVAREVLKDYNWQIANHGHFGLLFPISP